MLKKNLRKRLIENFNMANEYEGNREEMIKELCVMEQVPSFDKNKYKRNCFLTMVASFALLLLITIISANLIVKQSQKDYFKEFDQFTLTEEETNIVLEKCNMNDSKPVYYVSYDESIFVSIFCGYNTGVNYYYAKTDGINFPVIVMIGSEEVSLEEKGFYYIGRIEENSDISKIEIVINTNDTTYTYEYYLGA